MSESVKELIQKMAGEKTSVVQGIVASENPLQITLINDVAMTIPSSLLIVPEYLSKREKKVKIKTCDFNTESGGTVETKSGGTGSTNSAGGGNTVNGGSGTTGEGGSGDTQHLAEIKTGECTIDGVSHFHYVPEHWHGLNSHSHTIPDHNHAVNPHTHTIDQHKHEIDKHGHFVKIKDTDATIEIDDSLKEGELVHLLSVGKGKIYYVLGRV